MCFEHSLVRSPDLMRDRHIDQVIMCAIYVVCKVGTLLQGFLSVLVCLDSATSHALTQFLLSSSLSLSLQVLHLDVTFQEIMRQYRHQPQAKSHVYRSVLLNNGPRITTISSSQQELELALGGDSQPFGDGQPSVCSIDSLLYRSEIPLDSRGDIIQFYNKVYIAYIKDFVLRFSQEDVS